EAGEREPVVVVQGAPEPSAHVRFRQHNDLMYLCPAESPHAYLVIDGRGGQVVSTLYLPHQSPESLEAEGERLSASDRAAAVAAAWVDRVRYIAVLEAALERARTVFTPFRPGEGAMQSWDTLQRARAAVASAPWDGRTDGAARF